MPVGRAGASAALKLGQKDAQTRRLEALARRRAEKEKEIKTPSPFKDIWKIDFPLPGEPVFIFRRYWIAFSDQVRWSITYHPLFDNFIMFLILTNCVFLAIEYPKLEEGSTLWKVLKTADFFYNLLFTIEVAVKWTAYGFWGHFVEVYGPQDFYEKTYVGYFNDEWNILDFVIVLGGWFSMGAAGSVSALRVLRVLRPLRNVSHIPKLKQIVSTFFESLEGLFYVVMLLAFTLLVFGIIGLQLFSGALHSQCFVEDYYPTPGDFAVKIHKDSMASRMLIESLTKTQYNSGMQPEGIIHCSRDSECPPGQICDMYGYNPDGRMSSFDNIQQSVVNCFVSITLDWATLMFQVKDSYGSTYIWPFFYLLTFLVAFFALNLVLAVVCNAFDEEAAKQYPPGVDELVLRPEPRVPTDEFNKLCTRLKQQKMVTSSDEEDGKLENKNQQRGDIRKAVKRSRSRSRMGLKFLNKKTEQDDDQNDVDIYLATVALNLSRPIAISDHIRMKQFFHNYVTKNTDGLVLKKTKTGAEDNFKEGLVKTDFELKQRQPVNVQNIVLYNRETNRMMKYQGNQSGDVLTTQQIEEKNYEIWAKVQWPNVGWLEYKNLKKISRQTIEPKNKEWSEKGPKDDHDKVIYLSKHEFDSTFMSVFIKLNYDLAVDPWFGNFIMTAIVANAGTMSLEWPDIEDAMVGDIQLVTLITYVNYVFLTIFTVEMIIKHVGFGLEGYWSDPWNRFDGSIVIFSLSELAFQSVVGNTGGLSALRAFRLFRILRVLRLLNQFEGLRRQMKSIMASVSSVVWLLFLLLLFLFTFGILGTSIFGPAGEIGEPGEGMDGLYLDRYGWQNIYYSMLTIFQCITGDSWRSVQADTAEAMGSVAVSLYFIFVMVLGQFMLLNIFIAILLTNMTEPEDDRLSDLESMMQWAEMEHKEKKNVLDAEDEMKLGILCRLWDQRWEKKWQKSRRPYVKHRNKTKAMGHSLGFFSVHSPFRMSIHRLVNKDWFMNFIDFCIFLNCLFLALEDAEIQEDPDSSPLGPVIKFTDYVFTAIFVLEMALKVIAMGFQKEPYGQTRDWDKELIPPFASYQIHTGEEYKKRDFEELLMAQRPDIAAGFEKAKSWQYRCQKEAVAMLRDEKYIESVDHTAMWYRKWNENNWNFGVDPEDPFGPGAEHQLDFYSEVDLNKSYIYDMVWTSAHQDPGKKSDKKLMIIHFIIESSEERPDTGRFETRLCFDVTDDLIQDGKPSKNAKCIRRVWTFDMKKTKGWLVWESDPDDKDKIKQFEEVDVDDETKQIMESVNLDNKCTTAYWSDNWNKLDAMVVFFSVLSLFYTDIKFLRALRAIRPLRLAIRIPAIKVVVSTLVSAIKPAVFALIFCLFLFFILSILGVNLFVGKFFQCGGSDDFGNTISAYSYNEEECMRLKDYYGWDVDWTNYPFNFDNVGYAMIAIFVIASGDTWHAIMYRGMDAPQNMGGRPQLNGQAIYGVYFVAVMILAGFFSFNFVVSAIVDKFIEVQAEKDGTAFATAAQVQWQKSQRVKDKFTLERIPPRPQKSPIREKSYDIVNYGPDNNVFDNFITVCIVLNTFFMCLQHHEQSDGWTLALYIADLLFIIIFTLEAILKITAYKFGVYWKDNWNKFDFIIVLLSFPPLLLPSNSGAPSTSVFRVFRIGRILRLIKKARQLNLLFSTLVYSLPSLYNVGLLLFIVYFIFAVIGVSLFGSTEDPEGRIDPQHRNWKTWPQAMNLLYIGSTGDSWTTPWQGLMDNYADGIFIPHLYNLMFFVILGLIMLNLFIGVILDTYDQNDKINQAEDKLLACHIFTQRFNMKDRATIGHITVEEFMGVLLNTPWPIGFGKPLKNEHEDNHNNLKNKAIYERTKKRFEQMARNSKKKGKDEWIDPTQEEVNSHITNYSVEVKYWKNQNVWVVSFEQVILSFATKILNMDVEEETKSSKDYEFLKTYYKKQRARYLDNPEETVSLYDKCLQGMNATNDVLGKVWLEEEPDPDPDDVQDLDEDGRNNAQE